MKQPTIRLRVLEKLAETALGAADFFEAFLRAGYGASMRGIDFEISKIRRERERYRARTAAQRQARQRYHQLVYFLKRDGLIAQEQVRRAEPKFLLTARGKRYLAAVRERLTGTALPTPEYPRASGDRLLIVTFDVPEKQRRKRDWLREVLKHLGLRMVQRSVWIGRTKMPRAFLDDLGRLRLSTFVEIFEVSKFGSLRHLM